MLAFVSKLFTLFLSKLAKNAVFALCCKILVAEYWLRFNLLRKCQSAIAELRCASTESKSSLRKLCNALRWIYTVSVFRTFSSVFLRFCFSLKKYALFHPHFCKSISALSKLLYMDKNFVQKFCVWTIRAIFRNKAVPLYKKFFSENFCPVGYVTVWSVRIWTHKNADEKAHTLSRRSKNVKKTDENGRKTDTV